MKRGGDAEGGKESNLSYCHPLLVWRVKIGRILVWR